MHGFLATVKEWMEIPFAVNRAPEDHEAYGGWDGQQEEKKHRHTTRVVKTFRR